MADGGDELAHVRRERDLYARLLDLGRQEEPEPLLREALSVLTPAERQAIEAAFFSELTYQEVAVRFDQPLGTVKTRIRSGLGKLRQALGRLKGT